MFQRLPQYSPGSRREVSLQMRPSPVMRGYENVSMYEHIRRSSAPTWEQLAVCSSLTAESHDLRDAVED